MYPLANAYKAQLINLPYAAGDTAIDVNHVTDLPDTATDGEFNLVIWNRSHGDPADAKLQNEFEIVKVTAIAGTTLTVERAQEGTTALELTAGGNWQCVLAATAILFEGISSLIGGKVAISDIVNNLTSEDENKPLSAKQGKVLQDGKEPADEKILKEGDVEDSLNSTSVTKPLSANQGKVLQDGKEPADNTILKESDVEDGLNSTSTTKPLSANQGKKLNDDKASLSAPNTFQEKQTLNKDAEINSLTVGRGSGGEVRNTALGSGALLSNTTGQDNSAQGFNSLTTNTTGRRNTANGYNSLSNNDLGIDNSAHGYQSLVLNTTGNGNNANGSNSLFENTTGGNNIGIGKDSGRPTSPFTVTTQDNRIVMGNNDHTDAYIKIGWTVTSDKRDKTNFAEVPYGLDFVKELKPTKFQFREERGSEYTDGNDRYGFLAQDILELEGDEPVIIDNEDPENLKFKESHLVPVLVNAIQELTKEVETLKENINE